MKLYSRNHSMCMLSVCFFAIVVLSCGKQEGESPYQADTLDLFEVFFRYKFENNHSSAQQNVGAYFLQIEENNPPQEFLARFKEHSPSVKKYSEFVEGNDGLLFRISSYKQVGKNNVEIIGGYYEGNLSASWATYLWVKQNGKWTLKSVGPVELG